MEKPADRLRKLDWVNRRLRHYDYEVAGQEQVRKKRPHPFQTFRLGEDTCAKCGKPRAEHVSKT